MVLNQFGDRHKWWEGMRQETEVQCPYMHTETSFYGFLVVAKTPLYFSPSHEPGAPKSHFLSWVTGRTRWRWNYSYHANLFLINRTLFFSFMLNSLQPTGKVLWHHWILNQPSASKPSMEVMWQQNKDLKIRGRQPENQMSRIRQHWG